jgi:anti-sigma B factor antagonist
VGSLKLDRRRDGRRAVVSLAGDLDVATVPALRAAALAALAEPDCDQLVLDLAGLTFIDSTGIGCWIELRNRSEEGGQALVLDSVPPAALRTLRIAGLAGLFGLEGLDG